ncbi:MAG TPA: ATP-binding protein [Pseudomonadales bacterium]|nr:ATP-binding protein [Pseudomonadales bacterium]
MKINIEPRVIAIFAMGCFFLLGGLISTASHIDIRSYTVLPSGVLTLMSCYFIQHGKNLTFWHSIVFLCAHISAFITTYTTGGFVSLAAGWLILGPLMMTTMINYRAGQLSVISTLIMAAYILYHQMVVGDLVDTTPPEMKPIFTLIHTLLLMGFAWSVHFFFTLSQTLYEREKQVAEAKSQFLSNMSHELRTPMNGIYGALQIIQYSDSMEKIKHVTHIGLNSMNSLLRLIDEILDQTKLESGQISLSLEPCDINHLMGQILEEFSLICSNKHVELVWQGDIPLHHPIRITDETRLIQILRNVIGNAVKFTPKGTVSISIKEKNDELVFTVNDQGIGMSKQQLKRIFNRFEQADMSNTRQFGGTGLGLSITQQLVNLFGGEILAESQLSVGSTFIIRLPMPVTDKSITHVKRSLASLQTNKINLKDKKILVVDDEPTNRFVLTNLIEEMGAMVTCCHDGEEATLRAIEETFELIIIDNHMPKMSGIEAFKEIRKHKPEIAIFIHSGDQMTETQRLYKALGFDAILSKPIQRQQLVKALENTLSNSI